MHQKSSADDRWCFSREAKGQAGPKDVAGGVHIGVVDMTARQTSERALAAVGSIQVPAAVAGLGAVPGVHRHDLPTSLF
ncbi:MAG TPA: hypothetical protein VFH45_05795, partial [Acidimicrobiales bacterium]|nr:hypothetical protein [Acidimicrobiales bacterium]